MLDKYQFYVWQQLQEASGAECCPHCLGLGYITVNAPLGHEAFGRAFHCICRRKEVLTRHFRLIMGDALERIPQHTKSLTFADFKGNRSAQDAVLCAEQLANKQMLTDSDGITRPGLLLSGNTGTGKTSLAYLIFRTWFERGDIVAWLNYSSFLRAIRNTYNPDYQGLSANEYIEPMRHAELLVIDDLGAGQKQSSGHDVNIMFDVLDFRYAQQLPTVVTTNILIDALANFFDERINSRLRAMTHYLEMNGTDWRFKEGLAKRNKPALGLVK